MNGLSAGAMKLASLGYVENILGFRWLDDKITIAVC